MNNPITKQLFELLSEGSNITESRSIELLRRSTANFIDAVYESIGEDKSGGKADSDGYSEDLPPNENKSMI